MKVRRLIEGPEVDDPMDAAKEAEKRGGRGRRYWLTSAGRLVAGMKYLGQWEERVERVAVHLSSDTSLGYGVRRVLIPVKRAAPES